MVPRIVIRWRYRPATLLAGWLTIAFREGQIALDRGHAELSLFDRSSIPHEGWVLDATDLLSRVLTSLSVKARSQFSLKHASVVTIDPTGNETDIRFPERSPLSSSADRLGQIVTETDARVTYSRGASFDAVLGSFAEDVIRIGGQDGAVGPMVKAIYESIADPKNAFVHLYEVLEILTASLGKREQVAEDLAVDEDDISELGRLANSEPLQEGRHRGQNFSGLRPATNDELEFGRNTALRLLCEYLERFDPDKTPLHHPGA